MFTGTSKRFSNLPVAELTNDELQLTEEAFSKYLTSRNMFAYDTHWIILINDQRPFLIIWKELNSSSKLFAGNRLPSSTSDTCNGSIQICASFYEPNQSSVPFVVHRSLQFMLLTSKDRTNMFSISWRLNSCVWHHFSLVRTSQQSNSSTFCVCEGQPPVYQRTCLSMHMAIFYSSWITKSTSSVLFFPPANLINKMKSH